MEIKLDSEYRMTTSSLNFILEKRSPEYINKDGKKIKEKWLVKGYFSNIRSLLKGYSKNKQLESKATTFEELIRELKKIDKTIENFKVAE